MLRREPRSGAVWWVGLLSGGVLGGAVGVAAYLLGASPYWSPILIGLGAYLLSSPRVGQSSGRRTVWAGSVDNRAS